MRWTLFPSSLAASSLSRARVQAAIKKQAWLGLQCALLARSTRWCFHHKTLGKVFVKGWPCAPRIDPIFISFHSQRTAYYLKQPRTSTHSFWLIHAMFKQKVGAQCLLSCSNLNADSPLLDYMGMIHCPWPHHYFKLRLKFSDSHQTFLLG